MHMASSCALHVVVMAVVAKQCNPGNLDHLERKREPEKESALTFVWIMLTNVLTTAFTAVSDDCVTMTSG